MAKIWRIQGGKKKRNAMLVAQVQAIDTAYFKIKF